MFRSTLGLMDGPDRLERLTDLVLVLLGEGRAHTLDEIARNVPGYPEGHEARRQAFERDKRLLRDEGIPVITETVDGPEQKGYRIDPKAYYLPDPGLDADEQAALALAVAGVHLGDPSGRDALVKLGAPSMASVSPIAAFAPPPALACLFDAVRSRTNVSFTYNGESRLVTPAKLSFRAGHWYVIGWDQVREAVRTFRVDRIVGSPELGERGEGQLPADFSAQPVPEPWQSAQNDDEDLKIRIEAVAAPTVLAEVGDEALVSTEPTGAVVVALGYIDWRTMRSWILEKVHHAELLSPSHKRDELVEWLRATALQPPAPGRDVVVSSDASETTTPKQSGLSKRLRRLLAMIAWLAERKTVSMQELCERFEMTPAQVAKELEMAACCGTPPYTPGNLLEIVVTTTHVEAFLPAELARPRRLTPSEGLAVQAAATAILAVPGSDPNGALSRALRKLSSVLGGEEGISVQLPEPAALAILRRALEEKKRVVLDYHSLSADTTTRREVEPRSLVALSGQWYLEGDCLSAGGRRRFRVDRIQSIEVTDINVSESKNADLTSPKVFVPGPDAKAVVLALKKPALWLLDNVPFIETQPGKDDTTEVTLYVGAMAWFEQVLLLLGPDAQVLGPKEIVSVGRDCAARLLRDRYGIDPFA